jgi:hypothetical protein
VSPPATATPTPPAGATATPAPSASPVAALAATGGFDYRLLLAGLVLLVAGAATLLLTATRRGSSQA